MSHYERASVNVSRIVSETALVLDLFFFPDCTQKFNKSAKSWNYYTLTINCQGIIISALIDVHEFSAVKKCCEEKIKCGNHKCPRGNSRQEHFLSLFEW